MPDKQFSHVCAACRTPNLVPPWKPSVTHVAMLLAATLAGVLIGAAYRQPFLPDQNLSFLLLYALVGFAVAFAALYYFIHKRARTCPACHAERLIPVASPEGLRIMKELGFIES